MAIASRASSVAAPKIWNNLPPSITACDNYCTFKSKLKTHLFTTQLTTQRLCLVLSTNLALYNFFCIVWAGLCTGQHFGLNAPNIREACTALESCHSDVEIPYQLKCLRTVVRTRLNMNTARWLPLLPISVHYCCSATARIYGCILDTRTYGPYLRAAFTGSAYRP